MRRKVAYLYEIGFLHFVDGGWIRIINSAPICQFLAEFEAFANAKYFALCLPTYPIVNL